MSLGRGCGVLPNKIIISCFPGRKGEENHPNGIPMEVFSTVFKAKLAAPGIELVEIKPFLLFCVFFFVGGGFFFSFRKRSVLEWKVKALSPASGLPRSMSETSTFMRRSRSRAGC